MQQGDPHFGGLVRCFALLAKEVTFLLQTKQADASRNDISAWPKFEGCLYSEMGRRG